MTRRQNACASTLRVSSVSSHLPGNMSNTRVAARSPTPRRLYLRRTKNSLISRVPSPAKCAPSRINTKPASQPPTGRPRWEGSMARVIDGALADARALVDGGMDALLVENYGDAPFTAGRVAAATVAGVTAVAGEIRRAFDQTLLGVNVLKNDA